VSRRDDTNLGMLDMDAFSALMLHDENMIGTPAYLGIAYFWSHEYKHTLREVTYGCRRRVHHALLVAGLKLEGESEAHERIIDASLRAADKRKLTECFGDWR
jgi:hypothetical protein